MSIDISHPPPVRSRSGPGADLLRWRRRAPGRRIGVHVAGFGTRNMALTEHYCPHFHHTIELLGRRWTGVIVRVLATAPRRFGDIRTAIPRLSDRLLTSRLNELELEGIVHRCERDGNACYGLSEKGKELLPALDELQLVARRWAFGERPAERPGRIRSDTVQ